VTENFKGGLYALGAYGFWGVAPIYFKWVKDVPALEILSHRVLWSFVLLTVLILLGRKRQTVRNVFGTPSKFAWLVVSGLLVACNWLLFIWALQNDRMVESSLGYFINPLVSVVLGVLFMGEKLRILQILAVLFALVGVANEVVSLGSLPWVAVSLALSFGFYGLVRKRVGVESMVGLAIETALLAPLSLGYLIWVYQSGELVFGQAGWQINGLLLLAGVVTTFPLVCFGAAALRLSLSMLGFFQYLAPSMMLLLALFVYDEPFRHGQIVSFSFIWLGLIIFTLENVYHGRRKAIAI
jgi:chloramphenicol-sensitive protein RarD